MSDCNMARSSDVRIGLYIDHNVVSMLADIEKGGMSNIIDVDDK